MKFLKEPAAQFGALAMVLFGYYGLVSGPENLTEDSRAVVISQTDVRQLISAFEATWKRNPSLSELENLVEDKIREEILVREALALGLDRGDAVIRNRLRQKLEFIAESAVRSMQPKDEDLQEFLDDHSAEFSHPAKVEFAQFYLEQGVSEPEIKGVLEKLRQGQDIAGQPSLLPDAMPLTTIPQVNRAFGDGFGDSLMGLPIGEWAGPVQSGYGLHLVRVEGRVAAQPATLEDVRDKVQAAWYHAQVEALSNDQMDAFLQVFDITRPSAEDLAAELAGMAEQ